MYKVESSYWCTNVKLTLQAMRDLGLEEKGRIFLA